MIEAGFNGVALCMPWPPPEETSCTKIPHHPVLLKTMVAHIDGNGGSTDSGVGNPSAQVRDHSPNLRWIEKHPADALL